MFLYYSFDPLDYYTSNCSWTYPNGTQIYWNDTDTTWQRCLCAAQVAGDPDIGGLGVLVSFIATAVITIIIAAVEWYCASCQQMKDRLAISGFENDAKGLYKLADQLVPKVPPWLDEYWTSAWKARFSTLRDCFIWAMSNAMKLFRHDRPKTRKAAALCLNSLCDIQVVTSLAIMIAGLAQVSTMAYYHQQLVLSYWYLTLNSFWAAKSGYFTEHGSKKSSWRQWSRKVFVFISVVLSVIFQIMVLPRWWSSDYWDPFQPGHCCISHDRSVYGQNYIWISGEILYAASIVCLMISALLRHTSTWKVYAAAIKSDLQPIKDCASSICPLLDRDKFNKATWLIHKLLGLVLQGIFHLIKWLLWEWMTLWAVGDSKSLFVILVLFGFVGWNTYDIIDAKVSNRHLVTNEMTWGFGQVLLVIMLILVVLNIFDVFQEEFESKGPDKRVISRSTLTLEEGRELQALQSPHPLVVSETTLPQTNLPWTRRPKPEVGASTGNVASEGDLGEPQLSRRSTRVGNP